MAKVDPPKQHVPISIREISTDLYNFLVNQRFFDFQIWKRNGGSEDFIQELQDAVFASTEMAKYASELRQIKLQIERLASESNINLLKAKIRKLSISVENLEEQICGPTDLRPIEKRITALENTIERKTNLKNIEKRLDDIEAQL